MFLQFYTCMLSYDQEAFRRPLHASSQVDLAGHGLVVLRRICWFSAGITMLILSKREETSKAHMRIGISNICCDQ